jgi:hypothetical protein
MLALVGKADKSFQFSTSSILLIEFSSKSTLSLDRQTLFGIDLLILSHLLICCQYFIKFSKHYLTTSKTQHEIC